MSAKAKARLIGVEISFHVRKHHVCAYVSVISGVLLEVLNEILHWKQPPNLNPWLATITAAMHRRGEIENVIVSSLKVKARERCILIVFGNLVDLVVHSSICTFHLIKLVQQIRIRDVGETKTN